MIIERTRLREHLYQFATSGNGILIGQPGSGKTYELKKLSKRLHEEGIPLVFIAVDKLPINSDRQLLYELGIERPDDPLFDIFSYLEEERLKKGRTTGILVFDSLDAARSPDSQAYYLDLIRRCISRLNGKWNVIVSVRIYDAKKSPTLLSLFPSKDQTSYPISFTRDDIGCRHFWIPGLDDAEIDQAILQIPSLSAVYDHASKEFKQLVKIPFNLWLIENLMSSRSQDINCSAIQSETHLLKLFWEWRVFEGYLSESKQVVLTRITREMVDKQSLSVRKEAVFDFSADEAWSQLLSTEILESSSNNQRISYSHNILFDYAVSVLILEEDPDQFIKYLSESTARPIFLRPSLTFFFTRLLIDQHETFWSIYWKISPTEECHLRPFIQLLPTTTVALGATDLAQLEPLIERLRDGKDDAKSAIRNIIRALISVNIALKDALWLDFLYLLSPHLDEAFSWDLAVYLNIILDRARGANDADEVLQKCGKVSRELFIWVWREREKRDKSYFDNLGGTWATSLVAKTFDTDPIASKNLLKKVLSLPETESNFEISYISRLTDETGQILESDPEFLKEIYVAVFGHEETSDEITALGSPVLPLTSNRRQDYDLCIFNLTKDFSKFIERAPSLAAETGIWCIQESKRVAPVRDQEEEYFTFRGKDARYAPDESIYWDSKPYIDDIFELADLLFGHIQELAKSGDTEKIDEMLDTFRDHVRSPIFWRRLLRISTEYPGVFSERVSELCTAKPVLSHRDTIYDVCQFIEVAVEYFSPQQILQIEKAILKLPDGEEEPHREILFEKYVKRLIGRIPLCYLQTPDGQAIRADMEEKNEIPTNPPLISHEATIESYTQEDWLTDLGVDIKASENREFLKYSQKFESFVELWQNKIPPTEDIRSIYDTAHEAYSKLKHSPDLDRRVCNAAWTNLARCVETMSRGVKDPYSIEFKFCRQVLFDCAVHEEPHYNPQYDSQFTSPAWSPAPRHSAAEGLPWLATRHKDAKVIEVIEQLTKDAVPSVRYLATQELFRIWFKCPEEFWRIMQDIAKSEQNIVVQGAVCNNVGRFVRKDPERCVDILNILYKTISRNEEETVYPNGFLSMITGFAIALDNAWAKDLTFSFLTGCKVYHAETVKLIFESTSYLKPHNLKNLEVQQIFCRAKDWLESAIFHIAKAIEELYADCGNSPDRDNKTAIRDLYQALDEIITRIYFSAGVFKQGSNKDKLSSELQIKYYYSVKPILLSFLDACEQSRVIISPHTAHYFIELMNGVLRYDPPGILDMSLRVIRASTPAGYNFDRMGMRETVKLCETILSDHKDLLSDENSLKNLLDMLDIFVKAGWPEPLNLIWRLDEIYR